MIFDLPEAHALVAKQDLPIPAWLFAWAASIVLVVSFFALSAAWRKPRFEEERWRPGAAWLTTVLRSWPLQVLCGGLGVFLLGVGIYSGIHGTEAPDRNFAITFFFVTAWIGFPFVSALFGNVFPTFNPWRGGARVVLLRRRVFFRRDDLLLRRRLLLRHDAVRELLRIDRLTELQERRLDDGARDERLLHLITPQ